MPSRKGDDGRALSTLRILRGRFDFCGLDGALPFSLLLAHPLFEHLRSMIAVRSLLVGRGHVVLLAAKT